MRRFPVVYLSLLLAGEAVLGGAGILVRYHAAHGEERRGAEQLPNVYTHPELGFSFRYPATFRVTEIPQGGRTETVLVEDSAHARQGFQVFTQPYDDAEPLTEARIKQDQPDITMEHVAPLQVAGVLAISFVQLQDQSLGKTYEVWFVHDHTLYGIRESHLQAQSDGHQESEQHGCVYCARPGGCDSRERHHPTVNPHQP
jgi:hypothetical protein